MSNKISIIGLEVEASAFISVIVFLAMVISSILLTLNILTHNGYFGAFSMLAIVPTVAVGFSMERYEVSKTTALTLLSLYAIALAVVAYFAFFDWYPSYKEQRNKATSIDTQIPITHPGFNNLLEFDRCRSSLFNSEVECLSSSIVVVQSSSMPDAEIKLVVDGLHKLASRK